MSNEAEIKRVVTTAYKMVTSDLEKAERDLKQGLKDFFFKLNSANKKLEAMKSRINEIYSNEPEPEFDDNGNVVDPTLASDINDELENDGTGIGDLDEMRGQLGEAVKLVYQWRRDVAKRQEELLDLIG